MSQAPDHPTTRALPHCTESEKAMLACFMVHQGMTGAACAERGVTADWFYVGVHGLIFTAIMDLWSASLPIDFATVSGRIAEKLPDPRYVNDLCALPFEPAGLPLYLDTIRNRYLLRSLNAACLYSGREALDDGADPETTLAGLLDRLEALSCAKPAKAPSMVDLVKDKFRRMEANEVDTSILKTDFAKLDKLSPLRLGSMPLLSGERKAGKSMFAMNIAVNLAVRKKRTIYFTLEMPAGELVDRIYAKTTGIPTELHSKKDLDTKAYNVMEAAAASIATLPMEIRDDLYDLTKITAYVRQYKARHPDLSAVVVDYAQLVRVSLGKGVNREQEVAHVSRALRLLSMELKIAMIVLCQLNKEGESRESKALEQDCTAMWKLSSPTDKEPNERTVYIPFQRGGQSNIGFKVTYLGDVCRIFDYAEPRA